GPAQTEAYPVGDALVGRPMTVLPHPAAAPTSGGPEREVIAVAGLAELAKRLDLLELPDLADRARAIAAHLGYRILDTDQPDALANADEGEGELSSDDPDRFREYDIAAVRGVL
ncbi:hypothetical protein, partial [Nocardia acidivorans]|uniref:hypothetical protein n=1 Tax=Nocardia acidivorans TaxID=404580 RepID=UPI000A9D9414